MCIIVYVCVCVCVEGDPVCGYQLSLHTCISTPLPFAHGAQYTMEACPKDSLSVCYIYVMSVNSRLCSSQAALVFVSSKLPHHSTHCMQQTNPVLGISVQQLWLLTQCVMSRAGAGGGRRWPACGRGDALSRTRPVCSRGCLHHALEGTEPSVVSGCFCVAVMLVAFPWPWGGGVQLLLTLMTSSGYTF